MSRGFERISKPVYEAFNGVVEALLKVPSRKSNLYLKELVAKAEVAEKIIKQLYPEKDVDQMLLGEIVSFILEPPQPFPIELEGQVRIAGDAVVDSSDNSKLTFGFKTGNLGIGVSWGSSTRSVEEGNIVIESRFTYNHVGDAYFSPETLLEQTWGDVKTRVEALKKLEEDENIGTE